MTPDGLRKNETYGATVEKVVDGDTFDVILDKSKSTGCTRVRMIGIDTPETRDPKRPKECFGEKASEQTKNLLPKESKVTLTTDVETEDRYGRMLAYVKNHDNVMVNKDLVRKGYALPLTIPPNTKYAKTFRAAAEDAREDGAGLWSECEVDKKATWKADKTAVKTADKTAVNTAEKTAEKTVFESTDTSAERKPMNTMEGLPSSQRESLTLSLM